MKLGFKTFPAARNSILFVSCAGPALIVLSVILGGDVLDLGGGNSQFQSTLMYYGVHIGTFGSIISFFLGIIASIFYSKGDKRYYLLPILGAALPFVLFVALFMLSPSIEFLRMVVFRH